MSALEAFRVLMKDHLGPRLRHLGWQGSGANWHRPHPALWVVLGWQKDRYSTAASVSFTANLAVIAKDVWEAENIPPGRRPAKPTASTHWSLGWEERLGMLIPGAGGERWWFVRPGDDLAGIAEELLEDLSIYGLPAVDQAVAAAERRPHECWYNVGGRNWFEACRRPAEVELRARDRVTYRCAVHAASTRDGSS